MPSTLYKIMLLSCLATTGINLFAQQPLYDSLTKQLDSIIEDDQTPRLQLDSISARYAHDTMRLQTALKKQFRLMEEKDSVNQVRVRAIIDTWGWLGADAVGASGNSTLFLVIQHAGLPVQQKYLPMMREAVKNGKAKASSLALLEDRVALGEGRKQLYGSQVAWNIAHNTYHVLPLEDPDNADKRRAAVGLPPLAAYLSEFGIKWNVEQYKKERPAK